MVVLDPAARSVPPPRWWPFIEAPGETSTAPRPLWVTTCGSFHNPQSRLVPPPFLLTISDLKIGEKSINQSYETLIHCFFTNLINFCLFRERPESPSQYGGVGARRSSSPYANGRTELLIGEDNNKFKTSVENNNNQLNIENELPPR